MNDHECVNCHRAWYLGNDFWAVAWDTPDGCDHMAPPRSHADIVQTFAEEEEAALRSIRETITRSAS